MAAHLRGGDRAGWATDRHAPAPVIDRVVDWFANRYGVAGKYDAGMYETYLFGRTHVAGSTWTANLSNLDAAGDWSVIVEAGLGQKLEVVPFLNNQNYQIFMNIPVGENKGSPCLSDRSPDYLPWAGSVPIGSG